MSKLDIIRAWKDEEYREGLSAAERSRLPQNPAGIIELTEPDLAEVEGGTISYPMGCDSFITICSYLTYCPITITITLETEQLQ
jgi:mersacidin/lichenicidin family type 2 lantibiotic